MQEINYEAFISYRHLPQDTAAAIAVQKSLEDFWIPHALREKAGRSRLGKCFRDQDELPLSEDLGESIDTALQRSNWLIVICSPELRESKWCNREIDRFIELGKRDRIIPVLVSGEPTESFPEQLRFTGHGEEKVEVEPLSADLRAESTRIMRRKLHTEKLRIVARMLGVGYDDLRRRQRERRMKRALALSAGAATILAGFLAFAIIQNGRIEQQRVAAATNQAGLLIEKSLLYTQQESKSLARQYALDAYRISKTINGVNQNEALEALEAASYLADFDTIANLKTTGMYMSCSVFSPDDRFIAGVMGRSVIACFQTDTGEVIWTTPLDNDGFRSMEYSPDGTKILAAARNTGYVWVLDATDGRVIGEIDYVGWINSVAFFLDDDSVICAYSAGAILWNLNDGSSLSLPLPVEGAGASLGHAVSSAGAPYLLTWMTQDGSGSFSIYDIRTGKMNWYKTGIDHGISACCYSVSMDTVYLNMAGILCAVSLDSGNVLWSKECENYHDKAPHFLENGTVLFARTIYDASTGDVLRSYDIDKSSSVFKEASDAQKSFYTSTDSDALIDPNGKYVVIDGVYYDAATGLPVSAITGGRFALAWSNNGKMILAGFTGADFSIICSLGAGTQRFEPEYRGALTDIPNWSPMKGNENGQIMLMEDNAFYPVQIFLEPRQYISPDGRYVIMTNRNDYISLWDMDLGVEVAHKIYEQVAGTVDAAFSADSRLLALAGNAGMVTIYDLVNLRPVQTMTDSYTKHALRQIKFNATGNAVMVENYNGTIYWVYSVKNGVLLYKMHVIETVSDFGFDETTGDAVILYEDGSASIGQIFANEENLLAYASEGQI